MNRPTSVEKQKTVVGGNDSEEIEIDEIALNVDVLAAADVDVCACKEHTGVQCEQVDDIGQDVDVLPSAARVVRSETMGNEGGRRASELREGPGGAAEASGRGSRDGGVGEEGEGVELCVPH